MLDPWIIEEIRKREEEKQRSNEPLVIEAPLPAPAPGPYTRDEESPRGVIVIDL